MPGSGLPCLSCAVYLRTPPQFLSFLGFHDYSSPLSPQPLLRPSHSTGEGRLAPATTPVQRLGVPFAHSPSRISLPRKGCRVGLHIVLFEACSAFTHVTACTLARSPMRDPLSEGFSHFVISMTAPVASGWSICRVGLTPTGKRRLVTAHTRCRHSTPAPG